MTRKIIVVGAGINGLCAAWALARTGHRVRVFDSAPIPNTEGTSYDQHRLTRTPYGDQAGYTRMMAPGRDAWNVLWQDLGHVHFARTGCLALSTAPDDWTARSARTLDRLGIPYDHLDRADLTARFPMLRTDDAEFGLYDAAGGALFADRIMDGLVAWLREHGVELHGRTSIASVDPNAARVTTEAGERFAADALIVTAGVWTPLLFPDLTGAAIPVRQVVAYLAPPPSLAEAWRAAPVMLDLGGPRGMYLAPPVAGRGFKIGCGAYNRPWALDEPSDARPEDGPALLGFYRDRFARWDEFRILGLRVCRYAAEPDQRFLLRREGATWALTGCSGHGFKFGPLIGLALADAALELCNAEQLSAWVAGDDVEYRPTAL